MRVAFLLYAQGVILLAKIKFMVIFLGNVPVEEAHHERAKWVERLKAEGRLNNMVEDEKPGLRTFIAKFIGFSLMAIGLVLLVLILIALILMI